MIGRQQNLVHTCTNCGERGLWGPGWQWYGSWRDVEDHPEKVIKQCPVCSGATKPNPWPPACQVSKLTD